MNLPGRDPFAPMEGRHSRIPPPNGEHFWIAVCSYSVKPADMVAGATMLGPSQLLSVDGPMCAHCHAGYSDKDDPCPGKAI